MDRISELPPFIIHMILSCLSPKELAQTSILSKRWFYLRASFPVLEFDEKSIRESRVRRQNNPLTEGINETHESRYMTFVDVTLRRFYGLEYSMEKFKLCKRVFDLRVFSRIDEWIRLAVEKEVKQFDIDIDVIEERDTMYTLPQMIFSAKLLTSLKLSCCKIELPSDAIMLCSLKSLTLESVRINEQIAEKLTSECPLLENLSFSHCWGFKHLRVSKALKLKFIEIHPFRDELVSVEIIAPSLQSFGLDLRREIRLRIDMAGCTNLNKLQIGRVSFTDQDFHHLISKFPFLEHLYVSGCKFLERIMISSDRLKSLEFRYCASLKAIQLDAPNLKSLEFRYCASLKAIHLDTPNLISFAYYCNLIPIVVTETPCPYSEVCISPRGDLDTSWLMKLKEFLGVANEIEELMIFFRSNKISFNLDGLRESFASSRCQVKTLCLSVGMPLSNYRALFDGLIWCCCPRTLHVMATQENEHNFLKWLYEELRNRCVNCCNSHDIKCWRHYLKDVKILSTLQMEDWERKNWKPLNRKYVDLHDVWRINEAVIMWFDLDWVQ